MLLQVVIETVALLTLLAKGMPVFQVVHVLQRHLSDKLVIMAVKERAQGLNLFVLLTAAALQVSMPIQHVMMVVKEDAQEFGATLEILIFQVEELVLLETMLQQQQLLVHVQTLQMSLESHLFVMS